MQIWLIRSFEDFHLLTVFYECGTGEVWVEWGGGRGLNGWVEWGRVRLYIWCNADKNVMFIQSYELGHKHKDGTKKTKNEEVGENKKGQNIIERH